MKRTFVLASAAAAFAGGVLSLAACSDSNSPKTGTLAIALTDAPFPYDQVARADVYVVRVDAKLADTDDGDAARNVEGDDDNENPSRGWVTIAEPNASINLLELRGGKTTNLGQQTLPTGRYRGFRLILDTDKSSLTLTDGTVLNGNARPGIAWPSAGRTGIKVNLARPFDVVEGGALMVIDFDLGNSFVLRGNTIMENGLLFKPVVRATARELTGAIAGTVRSSADGNPPVAGASVQVVRAGTTLTDTVSANVVATTSSDAAGAYTAAFLLPGTYALRVFPPSGSALKPALVPSVTVTPGSDAATNVTLAP
ncbi:MAG: DUF4382 domain-containing protein [Gemmatimonadaceae bacterium]